MKKQQIKSLRLNKRAISTFNSSNIMGGSRTCATGSVVICEAPATDTCSINNADCNYTGDTGGGYSQNCDTRIEDTCPDPNATGTSNLESPC